MHSPAHGRRTAATSAGFLLPQLRPGQRLLDLGCGPGSITLGLAEAVAPGPVLGVDLSEEAIESARARAAGVSNIRFETADLYEKTFEPGSFDVVFAHYVLQHLPDRVRALRVAAKSLRPGGLVAIADPDYGGSILWPEPPAMRRAVRLMTKTRQLQGGDLYAGRKLARWLAEAGFEHIIGGASATTVATAESTAATGRFWSSYFAAPEFQGHCEAMGWATRAQCDEAAKAWRKWGGTPGAYWATFQCWAIGRAPMEGS